MTAIAALATPYQIVIAADSRQLNAGNGEELLVCKIRDHETIFTVSAGVSAYSGTGFNLYDAIDIELPESHFEDAVDVMQKAAEKPLLDALLHLHKHDHRNFERLAVAQLPMTIICARFKDNASVMTEIKARVQVLEGPPIPFQLKYSREHYCGLNSKIGSFFVGDRGRIQHYSWMARFGFKTSEDMIKLAKHFVQDHIDTNIPSVSAPIDIVQITEAGPKWIQKKEGC
jgi:hypothetical protein